MQDRCSSVSLSIRRTGAGIELLLLAGATSLALSAPAAALVITPTFDSTITGSVNSAAIQAEINTAIGIYQSLYSDPFTTTINFRYASTDPISGANLSPNTLAQSNWNYYFEPFNTSLNALKNDSKTQNDATAVANLPTNPLATNLDPTSANGRAIGLNTPAATMFKGNTYDGIVTINSAVNNFQFTRNANGTVNAGNFDAMQSIEHEIDEVLGLGSVLNFAQFPNDASNNTALRLEDLFRYSAPGTRSLTQSANATSYFSINGGTTNIIGFNQLAGGDYGDWFNGNANGGCNPLPNPPRVQFAFSCPGQTSDVSAASPEGVALDVIGYDLVAQVAVPEPGTLALLGTSLLGLAALRRRRT
jgi:PEP-CTERM motif